MIPLRSEFKRYDNEMIVEKRFEPNRRLLFGNFIWDDDKTCNNGENGSLINRRDSIGISGSYFKDRFIE